MRSGMNLGRISGIKIQIDSSWFLIFFLITWNLTAAFSGLHPDWSLALSAGTAVVAALLFFASVLAHELAHSLMAKAQGVNVRTIILHMFGGVSNIERNPPSPKAEFLITVVGPITSFILGALFILLSIVITGIGSLSLQNAQGAMARISPLGTLLLWLGPINIILAVFNLIPGFPLDGGRILRSILWSLTDDLLRATRWAARVGQFVAWSFILAGISIVFGADLPFFGSGLVSGLWLAFIGWFLNSASVASYQQILVEDMLEGVPVRKVMRKDPPTIDLAISVDELVDRHLMGTDERAFPVLEHGRVVGIVTIDDIRKIPRHQWSQKTAGEIMTPLNQVKSLAPDDDAMQAFTQLGQLDVRQIPVMEDGALLGLIRRRDILRYLQLQADFDSPE